MSVSSWADEYRFLTSRSSAEPGRWRTDRFPFTRAIMEDLSPTSPVKRIVFMGGRQIAKTEIGLNWIGYVIHRAPGPMLYVEPSVDMAKKTSRQRIAPLIEETQVLRDLVPRAGSRSAGNNMFVREFPGGILMLTGSNSSASLRSTPIRYLFANEADEYPDVVEDKGSALSIAEACTNNFSNRKVFINGNPGIRGASRIEREFLRGDQRKYFVPCPTCGHMDFITWSGYADHTAKAGAGHHRIAWEEGEPSTAHMVCGSCSAKAAELDKMAMLARGEWRPTARGDGTRSYHLSSLYSPFGFKSWADCATEFLSKKDDPSELRSFVNEVLGETWEERAEAVEAHAIYSRLETYDAQVPTGVGVLVAAVDVQGDRLEVIVDGYGHQEESWLVEWRSFMGDPSKGDVWLELDRFLVGQWSAAGGKRVHVEMVVVDSGGHHTDEVYKFCKVRQLRQVGHGWKQHVYAIKGGSEAKLPLVGRPTSHNRYRCPLYVLCVDTGKGTLQARLRLPKPGAGFVHLPEGLDREFCEQLASEKAFWRYSKGHTSRVWKKTRDRNEAFDLKVYSLAGLKILGEHLIKKLGDRAQEWAVPVDPPTDPQSGLSEAPPPAAGPARLRTAGGASGWVDSWR